MPLAADWPAGRDVVTLVERFTGTKHWNDGATLKAAYERHNAEVRQTIPPQRLLEWRAIEGWTPTCEVLGLPIPDRSFPWHNRGAEGSTKRAER